jgi:histone deacetylase complex regulatory component SIN3
MDLINNSQRQKHRRLDDVSRHSIHEENPFDENHFFERVRRHLVSQDTYNEFLKLINLFTQDFIDSTRLLKECRTYLGEGELLMQLKDILGWDDRRELYAMDDHFWPASGIKPTKLRQPKSNATFGSYIRLPAHVSQAFLLSRTCLILSRKLMSLALVAMKCANPFLTTNGYHVLHLRVKIMDS